MKYCVYWWHETSMNCIKVGYSKISHLSNPENRARAYAFKYQQLDFDLSSLQVHPMRSQTAAFYVEYHLLRWLNETCVNTAVRLKREQIQLVADGDVIGAGMIG